MSDDVTRPVIDIPSDGPAPVRLDGSSRTRPLDDQPTVGDTAGFPLG